MRTAIKPFRPRCDFAAATMRSRDPSRAMRWLVEGCGKPIACREDDTVDVACFDDPPRLADYRDERRQRAPEGFEMVAKAVEEVTRCPASDARVARVDLKADFSPMTAAICDRDFRCEPELDRIKRELTMVGVKCEETAQSLERTERRVVVDRLALETSCPPQKIVVVSSTAWKRDTERGYRLNACDRAFICTTAAGRTDCKPALDQVAPPSEIADGGSRGPDAPL